MHQAVKLEVQADALERRANSTSEAISAADPDAIKKLKEKIAAAKQRQDLMKAANAAIRKHAKQGQDAQLAALESLGVDKAEAAELLTPDFAGRVGFAPFELTNNNANIKRLEGRVIELERNAQAQDIEENIGGVVYREDTEENRAMFIFPGKPDFSTISMLKANGFKWAPSRGAWVRQLTDNARRSARAIISAINRG
jgi:hypothetical protein